MDNKVVDILLTQGEKVHAVPTYYCKQCDKIYAFLDDVKPRYKGNMSTTFNKLVCAIAKATTNDEDSSEISTVEEIVNNECKQNVTKHVGSKNKFVFTSEEFPLRTVGVTDDARLPKTCICSKNKRGRKKLRNFTYLINRTGSSNSIHGKVCSECGRTYFLNSDIRQFPDCFSIMEIERDYTSSINKTLLEKIIEEENKKDELSNENRVNSAILEKTDEVTIQHVKTEKIIDTRFSEWIYNTEIRDDEDVSLTTNKCIYCGRPISIGVQCDRFRRNYGKSRKELYY